MRSGRVFESEHRIELILTTDVATAGNLAELSEGLSKDRRAHAHLRTDGRTIREPTHAPHRKPRVVVAIVSIKRAGCVDARDEHVGKAVVVVVAPHAAVPIALAPDDAAARDLCERPLPSFR